MKLNWKFALLYGVGVCAVVVGVGLYIHNNNGWWGLLIAGAGLAAMFVAIELAKPLDLPKLVKRNEYIQHGWFNPALGVIKSWQPEAGDWPFDFNRYPPMPMYVNRQDWEGR